MRIGDVLLQATRRLNDCGIQAPHREARLLLAEVSGRSATNLMAWPEHELNPTEKERFERLIDRRCDREPLSRIVGHREFWSLPFIVTPDTLDPRPDTETVIEAALARFDRTLPLRILDLGTGTGCILLALLHEFPQSTGVGVDISENAVAVAQRNAAALALNERSRFVVGNWTDGLIGKFELIVSNPPYIPTKTIASLDPEVREHDPVGALDGGVDGLAPYRVLAEKTKDFLAPEAFVIVEIGIDQSSDITALFGDAGFDLEESRADLSRIPRALVFRRLKSSGQTKLRP